MLPVYYPGVQAGVFDVVPPPPFIPKTLRGLFYMTRFVESFDYFALLLQFGTSWTSQVWVKQDGSDITWKVKRQQTQPPPPASCKVIHLRFFWISLTAFSHVLDENYTLVNIGNPSYNYHFQYGHTKIHTKILYLFLRILITTYSINQEMASIWLNVVTQ